MRLRKLIGELSGCNKYGTLFGEGELMLGHSGCIGRPGSGGFREAPRIQRRCLLGNPQGRTAASHPTQAIPDAGRAWKLPFSRGSDGVVGT